MQRDSRDSRGEGVQIQLTPDEADALLRLLMSAEASVISEEMTDRLLCRLTDAQRRLVARQVVATDTRCAVG